jgi:hypothetical protein
MTLMDNVHPAAVKPADLSGCGRCVDLIGTGYHAVVDLEAVNMNDCISSYFWRDVDHNIGALELFEDINFKGNRTTIFLSEWSPGVIYSLADWYLHNRISSARWRTMHDRQTSALFRNADGSGDDYNNIKGWGRTKEIANFSDVGFNDRASAFRWDAIDPKKEYIHPLKVKIPNKPGSAALTSTVTGENETPVQQGVTVLLNNTDAQTVTVATTDTHVVGVSSTLTLSASEGVKDVASETTTWSITLSYSYTHSETVTRSETKTISLSISQTVNAPPKCRYTATLLVDIGELPPEERKTLADRWYDVEVEGSKRDPKNHNWWKRTEDIYFTMSGSLASRTTIQIKSTPLGAAA